MLSRNPLHCIVPPHMLDQIARKGSPEQRDWALDTLHRDHSLRAAQAAGRADRARRRHGAASPLRSGAAPAPGTVPGARSTTPSARPTARQDRARRGPSRPGRSPSTRPTTGSATPSTSTEGLSPRLDRRRRHAARRDRPLRQRYDNAFWDGAAHGVRRRRRRDVQPLHRLARRDRPRAHARRHRDEAGLDYCGQSGRAERVDVRRLRLAGQAVRARSRRAEQADWLIGAGLLGRGVDGKALRSMEEPGHGVRRRRARQGPAAGDHGRLRADDRPTTAACTSTRASRTTRSTSSRWRSAATRGRRPVSIWYSALRDPRLQPTARFSTFARTTARAARRIYGQESTEEKALLDAWSQVGIEA